VSMLYTWSLLFPIMIYLILKMNQINLVWASAAGFLVQMGQVAIGLIFHHEVGGYVLSTLPALGFAQNWVHFRQVAKAKRFV
jgi:hypothetical protein